MLDIADTDMKEYMEKQDDVSLETERLRMLLPLPTWPGCLIQAIDYLHEMKVKHKDLKPANILVKDGKVIITDFGIAKDVIDEETTASLISGGAQGSPMYIAPEINLGQQRGRAVDIFSLGCIFLEIATCLVAGPGARARFSDHRNVNGSRVFSRCPVKLLQWILFLWLQCHEHSTGRVLERLETVPMESRFVNSSDVCIDLAFLMLDPNPQARPTSRQLVQMIHSVYSKDIKGYACHKCSRGPMWQENNLPLHSTFRPNREFSMPAPESAFIQSFNDGWEGAKMLWLATHMWW
jgi:serine/threonine protein kinase